MAGLRAPAVAVKMLEMSFGKNWCAAIVRQLLLCGLFFHSLQISARAPSGFIAGAEGVAGQSDGEKSSPAG